MILVIFGAGASYDSVPFKLPATFKRHALEWRPPLANELFLTHWNFAHTEYPQCRPIMPYLMNIASDATIEGTLEKLYSESANDPARIPQFAAIRYYLRTLIWECERHWAGVSGGVTNYCTLLDQLRCSKKPQETVRLVTFNYDRLLDSALASIGVNIVRLEDYITNNDFKLFKVHGSVNWGRVVGLVVAGARERGAEDLARHLIDHAANLELSDVYHVMEDRTISFDTVTNSVVFPAIAIPVETKQVFECPPKHLSRLRSGLSTTQKILIVGWRGVEQHFLSMLKEEIKEPVEACAVCGDKGSSSEVLVRLQQAGIMLKSTMAFDGGFSEFVQRRFAEQFVRAGLPG